MCKSDFLQKCSLPYISFTDSSDVSSKKIESIDKKAEVYISNEEYLKMQNLNFNKNDIFNMGDYSKSFEDTSNTLELIIENSEIIQKGEKIIITPNGMLNSQKINKKNNIVLFGYFSDKLEKNKLDYILPNKKNNENSKDNNEGIFFYIYFKFECQKYFIKDYENGNGTFIKINSKISIKDNTLINIGDSYLIFTFNNKDNKENNIFIKAYSGIINYKPMNFKTLKNKFFTIGRSEDGDVILQDKMLSRIHCILIYEEEEGWFIKDGNEIGQPSTNGTWVFAYDEFEIYDNMLFKSNCCLFSCHLKDIKK